MDNYALAVIFKEVAILKDIKITDKEVLLVFLIDLQEKNFQEIEKELNFVKEHRCISVVFLIEKTVKVMRIFIQVGSIGTGLEEAFSLVVELVQTINV